MKNKKRIYVFTAIAVLIIALIGTAIYLLGPNTNKQKASKSTSKFGYNALKLNGEYVSQDIFVEEQSKFFQKWSRNAEMLQKTDEERNDLLLDEIIKRVVIEYYLDKKANITISSQEISGYISKYINDRYANMGGTEAYMQGKGYKTEADLKKDIEFYLKRVKYFSKVAGEYGITITDPDLEKEYQKQKIENTQVIGKRLHISNASRSEQASLKLAQELYDKLKNGQDFSELAKQYSEDEETKSTGGVMSSITGGIYSDEFDQAVFNSKPGQLVPPVTNMNGYDIVYVEKLIEFYHPKDELKNMLLMQKFGESDKFKQWLDKAKKDVNIEITGPEFKAFRFYKDKKYNEAAECYEELFKRDDLQMYLERTLDSFSLAENWDRVIDLSKTGIKKYPDQVQFYTGMAYAHYKKNNKEEAIKQLKKAEGLSKDNAYFKQLVAEMYSKIGMEDDAKRIRDEITKSVN